MRLLDPNEVESVRFARRSISMIRRRLLKPTVGALDACMPLLQGAIESIYWLQRRLGARESHTPRYLESTRGTLWTELDELRLELSRVDALMRNASGFYGGLARLLSPQDDDSTGYALNGPVSSRAKTTLQLER